MNSKSLKKAAATLIASAAALASVAAIAACGGDVSLGRGKSLDDLALSDGGGDAGDCPMSKCANWSGACASGHVSNLRCVADPNRGQGSDAIDACMIAFDCVAEDPCPMSACAAQEFACATGPVTNLQCIPDRNAGQGSVPPNACILSGECPDAGH